MKYPGIAKNDTASVLINDFSGGINKNAFNGNGIKDCENLILKGENLVTRPAVRVCPGYLQTGAEEENFPLKITDLVHYVNGKKYNITYYSDTNDGAYNRINVYLVNGADNILNFGYLQISKEERDPVDIIYRPKSVVFYSGTKTKGCGIYAFAGYESNTGKTIYGVFEAKGIGDNSAWYEVAEDERYIPTLLINGWGNMGEEGNEHYKLNLSEPEYPEKRNLISPHVKAYYSSDSMSWAFYLPERNIDVKTVKCRIHLTDAEYMEFVVEPGYSCTVKRGSQEYTAHVDYVSGAISFTDGNTDKSKPIPRGTFFRENNVVVIYSKSQVNDPTPVLSCNGAVTFNSRAYLYKSDVKPNSVYSCRISNPLYFPTNMQTLVGSDIEEITGAGYQNDKLIIFKAGETYKVNTSAAESEIKFVSPYYNVRFAVDSLSNETISTKVGCMNCETVSSCAGQLIWLGSDKKVYTLEATTYGSEKNVFVLSETVDDMISKALGDSTEAFAFVRDGYYYLFCGNYVFVCDCHITNMGYAVRYSARNLSGVSWYKWKLPQGNFKSGKNCGEIMITASNAKRNGFLHFEDKTKDTVYNFEGEPGEEKTEDISVYLETADYNLGTNHEKQIERIIAALSACPCDIKMITDNRTYNRHIHSKGNRVQIGNIAVGKTNTKRLRLAIASAGDFSLGSITVFFKAVK